MESNDELEDIILKKLQQYGDSVIGKDETSSKKVSTSSEVQSSNNVQTSTLHSDDKLSKKKRRKRKKKQVAMATENVDTKSSDKIGLSGHERKLHEMSEQLGLNEFKHRLEEDAMEAKEAKEGERKSKKQKEPEVVVFKSYKSKKDKDKESDISDGQSVDQTSEFDMKKARADVRRFGIGGLTGGSKYKAMTTLLVELGAKPPKNKCVNYKKLQVKRKREMVAEIEKRRLDKKLGYKVPKLDDKSKRPKDRNDIGYIDGHIGKWKNGAVVISKKELKNINKKPRLK